LAPVVSRLMADEAMPGLCGRVPRVGLGAAGAAAEWLPALGPQSAQALAATDVAFDRLLGSLPAGGGMVLSGLSPAVMRQTAAVLSWQGRALASTEAWRALESVDRALLLSLADEVGPPSFEQPSRSWAMEELDGLWLPFLEDGAHEGNGEDEARALAQVGVPAAYAPPAPALGARRLRRHRLVSIRLYPCMDVAAFRPSAREPSVGKPGLAAALDPQPEPESLEALQARPTEAELACIWSDEASLVFSVLQPEADAANAVKAKLTAADLQQGADFCGAKLQDLWAILKSQPQGGFALRTPGVGVLAALLLDERSGDVVAVPCAWHTSKVPPWCCPMRQRKADSLRRLSYWLHALPPLGPEREQQFVTCEDYAVGALRRGDGVQCWAITRIVDESRTGRAAGGDGPVSRQASLLSRQASAISRGASGVSRQASGVTGASCQASGAAPPLMDAVAEVLERVPESVGDLRTVLVGS